MLKSQAQTYNGIGGNIPDGGPMVAFTINVSGLNPAIVDSTFGVESVCLSITHPYVGDLSIRLQAPDGTMVDLSIGNGGSGNNYYNTCFSNNTNNPISNGNPPYNGTYRPQGMLGAVNNGQGANGFWKLWILDNAQPDAGSLSSWRIVFGYNPAKPIVFTSSDLPIVVINTNGQTIHDEPKITADMGIIYNGPGARNFLSDPFNNYNNKIGIEYRGSTSQGFPQKPYGIVTRDSFGADLDTSLLDMPSEHDWILYPPYNDKSLMRNTLTYDLSRKMGHYAARTKYCELMVNGQYQGIYVLMEKLKKDKHRVNISTLDSADIFGDDLTGGYIFKIDKITGNGGAGWTSNYLAASHPNNQTIYFQYEYPDDNSIVVQQESYLQSYVDSFEYALNSISLSDTVNGYRHFMDVNSFIDYFIVNELSHNVDGYRISTFLHKNKESKSGKLRAGPVWDFNIAYKNVNYCNGNSTAGWAYDFGAYCGSDPNQIPFWWNKLMTDSRFKNELKCRWLEMRSTFLTTSYINSFIDSIVLLTSESRQRHYDLWPILGVYVWPNPSPIPATYAAEITVLKNFISARINWLDTFMPGSCTLGSANLSPQQNDLLVYPNPVKSIVTLQFNSVKQEAVNVQFYASTGQMVYEQVLKNNALGLQTHNLQLPAYLSNGIYLIKISSPSMELSKKISIEK